MRRRIAFLAVAAFLALAGLFVVTLWLVTGPGFLNTERITTGPAEVAAIAAADLGLEALPEGVAGIGLREDGFQDRIVWVRLAATDSGLDALLAEIGVSPADLGLDALSTHLLETLDDFPLWRPPSSSARSGETTLTSPTLAYLALTLIEDGATSDLWHIYLRGHEI